MKRQNTCFTSVKLILFVFIFTLSVSVRAEYIDDEYLSNRGMFNVYPSCKSVSSLLCLDYAYGFNENKSALLVFRYTPTGNRDIDIKDVMKRLMLTLLIYHNPVASDITKVEKGKIERNFTIEPFLKERIAIGMTSRYKGLEYSGFYEVSSIKGAYFSYDIQNTTATPLELLMMSDEFDERLNAIMEEKRKTEVPEQ